MKSRFQPNPQNLIDAAFNREAERLPLYEHKFSIEVMECILGCDVGALLEGGLADKTEAQHRIARFSIQHGYDCVPFERGVTAVVQQCRGLKGQGDVLIASMEELEQYPWEQKPAEYIAAFEADFEALRRALPEGMKAVGGIGNGLFETVQDFVPYQELAFLQVDEPDVYSNLWKRVGDLQFSLWRWLLEHYGDTFAVCRFGDDLGFRSNTLLQPDEIRRHIIPQYKRIVDLVHSYGKPFLLHSCGRIYDVMDDLIDEAGIDAKHSNEDAIDPFPVWVDRYGERIGNFGGVEMNVLCLSTPTEIKAYVRNVLESVDGKRGIAIGSGNQISSYVPPTGFMAMTEAVREWRGD